MVLKHFSYYYFIFSAPKIPMTKGPLGNVGVCALDFTSGCLSQDQKFGVSMLGFCIYRVVSEDKKL